LNQIPAGVRKNRERDGPGYRRLHREDDALVLEALHLTVNRGAFESGRGNTVLHERGLIGACGGVSVRFEHQLEIARTLGGDDGDPTGAAGWKVLLLP